MSAVRVVAVVPVFDGEKLLEACIDALLATDRDDRDLALDIVVVDDGSNDASVAVARGIAATSGGRVRVLDLGLNHGFAGAVQRGVASVLDGDRIPSALDDGRIPDVVAFVNQDCVVSPGWLVPLLAALEDPGVGVAGARLLDADGVTLQHAGARIEANGLTSHLGRGSRDPAAWREQSDPDYVCGALIAMRTATWIGLGGFDEGYAPAYYEEVDFCVRARRSGLRVVYVPGSEARHLEASCSGAGSPTYLRRYHRSRLRFVVRRLVAEVGVWRWLRAEATWLAGLRRWHDVAPVLRAYARVPLLLAELARERRRSRCGDDSAFGFARERRDARRGDDAPSGATRTLPLSRAKRGDVASGVAAPVRP